MEKTVPTQHKFLDEFITLSTYKAAQTKWPCTGCSTFYARKLSFAIFRL